MGEEKMKSVIARPCSVASETHDPQLSNSNA